MLFYNLVNQYELTCNTPFNEWRTGHLADFSGRIYLLHHSVVREAKWLDDCFQEIAVLSLLDVEPFGHDIAAAVRTFQSLYEGRPAVFEATSQPHPYGYVRDVIRIDWCSEGGK